MQRASVATIGLAIGLVACGGDNGTEPAEPPVITGVAPEQGTAGTELRIEGSRFQAGAAVRVGDMNAPGVDLDAGALFAAVPAGVQAGTTYDVVVTNPDGGSTSLAAAFTAVAPEATRVNGVTRPTGLVGMTVIIEGSAFGDDPVLSDGRVYFGTTQGTAIEAAIVDPTNDWTDGFVVTSVPQGVSDTSWIWVETATGVSDSVEFRLIQSGTFSPSLINWTPTTSLPHPLQGLGAAFVPVEEGPTPASYVFTMGGAGTDGAATDLVFRATVSGSGALGGEWSVPAPMPEARAYHAAAAATASTAALDTSTTAAFLYAIGGVDTAGSATATAFVGHVDLAGEVTGWTRTEPLPVALHSARAALFRGFLYLTGGVDADGFPVSSAYRAAIHPDGSLGSWVEIDDLPAPTAYHSFVNFGPFLYLVGGDSAATPALESGTAGSEVSDVYLGRINLRTGDLDAAAWSPTASMAKGRSKHSTIFAGGSLLATSGIYAGQAGSSENTAGDVLNNGTVESWGGATGSETIAAELGYSLYNQAAITFIDAAGQGHVLVLGGARRDVAGQASDAVVYY
ncbi:MAG: hypothetical protein P8177_01595 [Gemmatimonadota bacterium]